MRRIFTPESAKTDSFQGMLEEMTGDAGQTAIEPGVRSRSTFGRGGLAAKLASRESTVKTNRFQPATDRLESQELSYEHALRRHARRRVENDVDFSPSAMLEPAPMPALVPAPVPASVPTPVSARRASGQPSSKGQPRRTTSANVDTAAKRSILSVKPTVQPTSPVGKLRVSKRATGEKLEANSARTRKKPPVKAPARASHNQFENGSGSKPAVSPRRAPNVREGGVIGKEDAVYSLPSTRRATLKQILPEKPAAGFVSAQASPNGGSLETALLQRAAAQARLAEKQQEEIRKPVQLAPRSHLFSLRRAIVSVRLSEEEESVLRARASESGISVSAYMRSCVLDAENLRAQVKQALAEMRAATQVAKLAPARPGPSAGLSIAVRGTAEGGGNGGMWSRLIARSATFFLGPWFPFRHSA